MKLHDLIDLCTAACPREVEWSKGEAYGPYDVRGNPDITKVLYCVTPTPAVNRYAAEHGYQFIISHHPCGLPRGPHMILHTALDCCEGGLNDMWRDAFGLQHAEHFDGTLGWSGSIDPMAFDDLVAKCGAFAGDVIGQRYLAPGSDPIIRSVVICTGLGGMVNRLAAATGADCYILGQNTEPVATSGFKAVIEVGHTLTEWIGVRFFQSLLGPHGVQVDGAPLALDRFGTEVFPERKKEKTRA